MQKKEVSAAAEFKFDCTEFCEIRRKHIEAHRSAKIQAHHERESETTSFLSSVTTFLVIRRDNLFFLSDVV